MLLDARRNHPGVSVHVAGGVIPVVPLEWCIGKNLLFAKCAM